MNSITINGVKYEGGRSISVHNNVVKIDGKTVDHGSVTDGILKVEVTGTLLSLEADGDVECNDVQGTVQAGGDVRCGDVGSSVQCGGDVRCGKVGRTVMAGGDVRHA